MTYAPVSDVLKGQLAVDSEVTVRGWIRSRRDSKAGISFLAIYDGSCFDPIQPWSLIILIITTTKYLS